MAVCVPVCTHVCWYRQKFVYTIHESVQITSSHPASILLSSSVHSLAHRIKTFVAFTHCHPAFLPSCSPIGWLRAHGWTFLFLAGGLPAKIRGQLSFQCPEPLQ